MVLVDNAAYSYAWQVDNGIPIIPYYDNKEDRELLHLEGYLKCVSEIKITDYFMWIRDAHLHFANGISFKSDG